MIRLSVLYPKTDGAKFDHDYYRDQHVPLAVSTWGVERVEIDKGVNGPYEAAVHFFFPSTDAIGAMSHAPRHSNSRISTPSSPAISAASTIAS